jgi:CspA family cold shock protein
MSSTTQTLGQVKWFNKTRGFGYITIVDGNQAGTDVFVHQSSLKQAEGVFRYLVDGEYVSFSVVETNKEGHSHEADDVTGVNGGKLQCQIQTARPRRTPSGTGTNRGRGGVRGRGRGRGRGGRTQTQHRASGGSPAPQE